MLRRIPVRQNPRTVSGRYAAWCARHHRVPAGHWPTHSREELLDSGARPRELTEAVRAGHLIRARENVYLSPDADPACVEACRVGGCLACVSELARWGVFVLDATTLHVQVSGTASRLRRVQGDVRVHWTGGSGDGWASVDLVDALISATRCQPVRAAVATLDSALHLGLIDDGQLAEVLAALPERYGFIGGLLDARAESGTETLMRLLLRMIGCGLELQVEIRGVGRVDLLVDGWLIIECDSREFHESWAQQRKDRRRDQAAAALGFTTYRPIAEDILWHPERVAAAVRGLLAARGSGVSRS